MIEVTSVSPQEEHKLLLTFNTGETRCFDMKPYLKYPVFRDLKSIVIFKKAKVQYGTVTWPNEIDIAPETLYGESFDVPALTAARI